MDSKQDTFRPHTFTCEYPKKAAEAILRNTEYLEKLIPNLGWQIEIFAGYNILPEECDALEPSQLSHFQGMLHLCCRLIVGDKETVWLDMDEKEMYINNALPLPIQAVTGAIGHILSAIADNVFPTVGFLFQVDRKAVMYDPGTQVMNGNIPGA